MTLDPRLPFPPKAVTRLRTAMEAYDRATLGSLNVTADEVRAAATACGWAWDGGVPLIRWSRDFLQTQTDGAAR